MSICISASTLMSWAFGAQGQTVIWMIIFGAILWMIIYLAWGLRIVSENTYLVVERFGAYYYVKTTAGIVVMCLPGLIDRVAPYGGRGDFKYHRIDLYTDEPDNKIDFVDGSATIVAQIWFRVNPNQQLSPQDNKDGPYRFVYRVENTENRIEEILDGTLRPVLQTESIDSAQKNMGDISRTIREMPEVKASLDELGVELDPNKGFLITDIKLDDETIAIRRQTLEGIKEAEKTAAKGKGFVGSILAIMELAKESGNDISFSEAREIFERQVALDTVRNTGANVTLVAPSINGVNMLLGIGEQGGKNQ